MAQLPPVAVFGSAKAGQAVHVLLLIENSLAMLDHWADLQQHILPGVLGAVRIANPGIDVQVFCMTTGKTQDPRVPSPNVQKSQRQFNDFPDIDIVNLPRNRMSATFIRQSIDMFLGGPTSAPHIPVTRHLFVVAMSNPIDDIGSPPSPTKHFGTESPESPEAIWSAVAQKLQEMRAQSRQEVIPWQPVDNTHCICHLSGSNRYRKEKRDHPAEDWPEMILPVSAPPSPRPGSAEGSDEEQPYMSPMDLIHDNLALAASRSLSSGSSSGSTGMSLVSRMQALHGLANRRRPGERTRSRRTAFFRDSPAHAAPSPSPRRERLRSLGSTSGPNTAGPSSQFTSSANASGHYSAGRPIRARHHSFSSTSALELQGLPAGAGGTTQSTSTPSQIHAQGVVPFPDVTANVAGIPPPSSPASDTSGSTLSNSFMSLSNPLPSSGGSQGHMGLGASHHHHQQHNMPPLNTNLAPAQSHFSAGPSYRSQPPSASPRLTQALHSPTLTQAEGGFSLPLPSPIYNGPIFAANTYLNAHQAAQGPTGPSTQAERGYGNPYVGPQNYYNPRGEVVPPMMQGAYPTRVLDQLDPDGRYLMEGGDGGVNDEDEDEDEVVPASAPPDARGQVPFVFDTSYEQQNALRLRHAVDEMRHHYSPPGPGQAQSSLQPQVSQYAAPGLEATRSGSSQHSDGSGRGLGLALDESWKGLTGVGSSGQIPEFPETFYEPSRARLADRGAGVRRSTHG